MNMNARLSDESRHILTRAAEESRQLHHAYTGTEHLLLALLADPPTLQTLAHFHLTPDQIRTHIATLIQPGPAAASDIPTPPLTPRAQRALEIAAAESAFAAHKQIDPPHLLLALFLEEHGIAGLTLRT